MDGLSSNRILGGGPTMAALLRQAVERWRLLLLAVLGGVVVTLLAVRATAPHYTAQMVVGPVARTGAASMGPQLPALVGSVGRAISEPGSGDELLSDYTRFLRLLGSTAVAERMAAGEPSIMRGVFHRSWDAERQAWVPPSGPGAWLRRGVLRLTGREPWSPPDAQSLADHLRGSLVIQPLGGGPMQRIAYRHHDRAVALAVVGGVHAAADATLRAEAARRILAEMEYIRARLEEVTQAEHRKALVALLAEHERLRMMIDVDLPLAADLVEPVTAPVLPDWPDPLVLVPFGGLLGLMAGLFWVYGNAARSWGRP